MTDAELDSVFATRTPSRTDVEERADELFAYVEDGWTGRYLVTVKDGEPDELYFFGISGD